MRYTEERSEPRYAFSAGFVEINDQTMSLDDLSAHGLGFFSSGDFACSVGDIIDGFLVLQAVDDQFEMPISLTVRRIEETRVGCSMTCPVPHHGAMIADFIATQVAGGS